MEEKEIIKSFLKEVERVIEEKLNNKTTTIDKPVGIIEEEEWSENKYNFMKKYGHI